MSKGRLTRHELGWLLAQEARGAAKALREGVTQLRQEPIIQAAADPPVETSLDALDDAIELLSELEAAPASRRRGRIDLAALLYESVPGALISIEPGAGTEVFGEERELRRMLHMLVGQSQTETGGGGRFAASEIQIRREDDWIRISVELGPDTSATMELERRWLSRTALRLGGRFALEGGVQTVFLPADGSSNQREVLELRKELAQAQQLGEVYARELATVFGSGDTVDTETAAADELLLLRRFAKATRAELERNAAAARARPAAEAGWQELGVELSELAELEFDAPVRRLDLASTLNQLVRELRERGFRGEWLLRAPEHGAPVLATESGLKALLLAALRCVVYPPGDQVLIEGTIEAAAASWRLTLRAKAAAAPAAGEVPPNTPETLAYLVAEKLSAWFKAELTLSTEAAGVRLLLSLPSAPPAAATPPTPGNATS